MKKFFLTLVLLFVISVPILGQATLVDTLSNAGTDTLVTQKLWGVYVSTSITVENLGTGEDTLSVKIYSFIKDPTTGTIVDTMIASPWMKDYEGTDVTILLVPEATTRTFLILRPGFAAIEVALTTLTAGNSRVAIESWK